jgi:membrane-associated protease RseP (regulator of RpoE activity)
VRLKGENIQTFELYDEHKKLLNNEEIESKIINSQQIFDKQGNLVETMFYEEILSKLRENTSKDSLLTKPYYQQAIIVLAGIFMNFLLAWIIFSVLFFV